MLADKLRLQTGGSAVAWQVCWGLRLWRLSWSPCSAMCSCCTATCTAGHRLRLCPKLQKVQYHSVPRSCCTQQHDVQSMHLCPGPLYIRPFPYHCCALCVTVVTSGVAAS